MDNNKKLSEFIVNEAIELGFSDCGIAKADFLKEESTRVENWLSNAYNGTMSYLERNKEKRYDPRLLTVGVKSVVTVLLNYYPQKSLADNEFKIAKYAYGDDYHTVIKGKLKQLQTKLEDFIGTPLPQSRAFTDSAPLLDRAWAARCGLGFIGKNTNLINPKKGSFFFIGHLLLPIDIEPVGKLIPNRCGSCTRCLDACPTQALVSPFTIDATKCISYLTIEYKGDFQGLDKVKFNNWIYGCDICQDVCPYNKFSVANIEPRFQPSDILMNMKKKDWINLDEKQFKLLFAKSAIERAGYEGLKRNIIFLADNQCTDN